MAGSSPQTITDLGALHRVIVQENITLKSGLTIKGIDLANTPSLSPLDGSPAQTPQALPSTDTSAVTNGDAPQRNPNSLKTPDERPERQHNAAALKHLTHGIPASLSPFFVGTSLEPRLSFICPNALPL